ncbi:MAG: methionine--tRNA ligase [Fimbriimonadales bacterium]|nr:MAG: methionine--tRNA ligase [Fimbriimonadales bacterium]
MKRYYITTPIYYVNSAPHIGTALTTIVADACARFQKQRGREVYFLTGTDENAPKVNRVAQERGIPTQQFVDEMAEVFEHTWRALHIEYDIFIRTTEERHKRVVSAVFQQLREQGDIYKGSYQGWYCLSCETFFASSKIDESRACPDCGKPLEWRDEPCYYFRLSAYESRLREHIKANPQFIQPEVRRNETLGFINEGLQDIAVSRTGSDWGVPVPDDPESGVVYVWFDALLNYLTATGWLERGKAYLDTWPPELQLMGKDILPRFHATIWPAMLMALNLPLPERLYGHGWWIVNQQKMSKSLGNVYAPLEVSEALARASGCELPYAVDAFRYYMLREMPTDADAEFSLEGFESRYNGDLANDLGNLLHRTLSMMHRYFDGRVPDGARLDAGLADLFAQQAAQTTEAFEAVEFPRGLREAWQIISAVNRYYDEQAPWTLMKQGNTERAGQVLYAGLIAARLLSGLIEPVMPQAARAIAQQLNLDAVPCWNDAAMMNAIPTGHLLQQPKPIFPRLQRSADAPARAETTPTRTDTHIREPRLDKSPQTMNPTMQDTITIDDFKRLQIRIATVKAAEPVPKSTKLLKLTLDVGGEERTIVAGIAEDYTPEQIVGKQIPVLVNLQPALIRGIVSEGMMLAADVDGKAVLLHPDREIPSGSGVR